MINNTLFARGIWGDTLALLSGALLTLAFAPFSIYPCAIISLALLLVTWLPVSPKRAMLRGFLFGIGLFGTGVSWVFISIHIFGEAPIWLASLITSVFVAILALFPAVNGFLFNYYFKQNTTYKRLLAFPALWVLLEWVRSWIFTGFPWLLLGYSQIDSPLRGYAPIFSVYGLSLAVIVSSALLINLFYQTRKQISKTILSLIAIWLVGWGLSFIHWTQPMDQPIKISLIQGNIPQNLKWTWEELTPTLQSYQQLTEQHWDSQIIIWPEAAIPIPFHDATDYLRTLHLEAKKHNTAIITGIPIEDKKRNGYYNAVFTVGNGFGYYYKSHLVPFGEFTPMADILGNFLDRFHLPLPNTIPSTKPMPPIIAHDVKVAPFICYEIAFPELVLKNDGKIDLLLTVSNDAWFGKSIALAQHLEMAQMRALEMGRPAVFVSNTGITAFILPNGQIQSRAPIEQKFVLTDTIQKTTGKTPWQRLGMDPILILLTTMLVIAGIMQRKSSKKRDIK